MNKYVCIHAHFYQPPRENPWLEEVELQDSAYPHHDWNEKITAECYAPNTASRILGQDGKIIDIVNNYSKISFNVGPTLLYWLEKHEPEVYQAILEADRLSMKRFSGHGSAIAQVYNHIIMPLANKRDKYTQVVWGIKDFQKRFKRFPEGMWLSETAVDTETLEILAELGIRYTVLAPCQAKRVRSTGKGAWKDVSGGKINPAIAYLCRLPSGRSMNLFFYNAEISHDVAFGGLLNNGELFAKRLAGAFVPVPGCPQMVHIATDGETYGHHFSNGDMALSYCLYYIESNSLAKMTVYGEYLEKHPPAYEVEIIENSSWSCVHGIERWRCNCGCSTGHPGWNQEWRRPLREAMDWLREKVMPAYEKEASKYLRDPWKARDDYIDVILERVENVKRFLGKHATKELSREEKVKVLKLLEMQRNAMLMYTSCGWFFDEISGIESVKVMEYASAVMHYLEEITGLALEQEYLNILEKSPGNVFENSSIPYAMFVKPAAVDLLRVGAHYAISSLFEAYPENIKIYCYSAKSEYYTRMDAGRMKLATGKLNITSDITLDEKTISFAVLHLGDITMNGGVREFLGEQEFYAMQQEIKSAFEKSDTPSVIRLMHKHFGTHNYSLWHLFRDEQRKIVNQVLNNDLRKILEDEEPDLFRAEKIINEARKWCIDLDTSTLDYIASSRIDSFMQRLDQTPEDTALIEKINRTFRFLSAISLRLNLWKAQNIYFFIGKRVYSDMAARAEKGDRNAGRWMEVFRELGSYLRVKT